MLYGLEKDLNIRHCMKTWGGADITCGRHGLNIDRYDRVGRTTDKFFSSDLTAETRSKLFMTVIGNHDYWVLGSPARSTTWDQCGNGFVQYYGMDTRANTQPDQVYDLSVDPAKGRLLWGTAIL